MSLLKAVQNLFEPILLELSPERAKVQDYLAMVKPSANTDHGDYQANFAMVLAKAVGQKPQELAKHVISKLPDNPLIESATTAGPGFINIKLNSAFLIERIAAMARDERLGVAVATKPKTFVIDMSGPNVAKPLHVGHLRSTIIGDALVRILRFCGHRVISDNHLGDWGTQFGILIYGYKHYRNDEAFRTDPVRELARLYVHVRNLAKASEDDDETAGGEIMDACRNETAKLHAGDPENLELWKRFMPACLEMLRPIYERLNVTIDHALGESFYHGMLPAIVDDLLAKGIAVESHGAIVIPNARGIVPKDEAEAKKEEPPALIRKRDGAFTYTTTDLATIRYRAETWKPDAMLYVVDARQALHFKTLFANARRWGYANIDFEHIQFGSILGKDKKPYRTRDGGTIELATLLDEAAELGLKKYEESYADRKSRGQDVPELTDDVKRLIAETVGYGAVKYADLSSNRTTDYVFDYDRMLATEGNTATYMQYAYARCRSIFRKGEVDEASFRQNRPAVLIATPQERALAVQLLKLPEVIEAAATEYLPHYLTGYLWDLAKSYSTFFEACPVLKAETADLRASRLVLVELVARTIQTVLDLLGIRTVERM